MSQSNLQPPLVLLLGLVAEVVSDQPALPQPQPLWVPAATKDWVMSPRLVFETAEVFVPVVVVTKHKRNTMTSVPDPLVPSGWCQAGTSAPQQLGEFSGAFTQSH